MSDKTVIKSENNYIHLKFFASDFKLTIEHCRSFLVEYLGVADSIITIEVLKGNVFQIALDTVKNKSTIGYKFNKKNWHYVYHKGSESYYVQVTLQRAQPIKIQGVPHSYSKERVVDALSLYGFVTSIEENFKIFGLEKIYMGQYRANIRIYSDLPEEIDKFYVQLILIANDLLTFTTRVMVFADVKQSNMEIKEIFNNYGTDIKVVRSRGKHYIIDMVLMKPLPTKMKIFNVMYVDEDKIVKMY